MTLEFFHSFGFTNVHRSIAFYNDSTVIFPAGKICVLLDLDSGMQTHFQFAEHAEVSAIIRCDIFIAGAIRGSPPTVCLFNTLSETNQFYSGTYSMESKEFMCLSASANLKFIAAQGASPDWLLVIWLSQTCEIVTTFSPTNGLSDSAVFDISFHAGGRDELVVVGKKVFKLYEYQDEPENEISVFKEIPFEKFEKYGVYRTIGWPEKENLVVGSAEGRILFFRGIEMVREVNLDDDLKKNGLESNSFKIDNNDKAITSLVVTPQQLLCAFAGFVVLIYEGEEISSYVLTKFIYLEHDRLTQSVPGEIKEESDHLINIIVNLSGKNVVATTSGGQMLRCCNFAEGRKHQHFTILLPKSHDGPIIGIDVSTGRPLILCCSQHVITLWNYSNRSQELRKLFKDKMNSAALHPTGLFIALSFDHFCRIFNILHYDLKERMLLLRRNCSNVEFSPGGQFLAVVSESLIEIYSFITFELLFKLDGHAGLVTSFDWIKHDTKLISCDNRGVLCSWDLVSSKKIWEYTSITSYLSVSANRCTERVVVATSDCSIRCFDNSQLQWNLKCAEKIACVLYCSTSEGFYVGTSNGCIEFYSYPLSDEKISVCAHSGKISGLKYVSKSDFVISSGSDGCIFLWKTSKNYNNDFEGIYSKLCLVDKFDLENLKYRSNQLRLSLQHTDTASDFEFELKCIKQEETTKTLVLNHTSYIDELNEQIFQIKEEMQNLLFDFDFQNDCKELDLMNRHEIIDTTFKLHEAYQKTNSYADETDEIILDYENMINNLTIDYARNSCTQSEEIENIKEKIKTLENTLFLEKEINKQIRILGKEYKNKHEEEMADQTILLKCSQKVLLENEKSNSIQLKTKIEKLKQITDFIIEDMKIRKIADNGEIDYDIKNKINTVNALKNELQQLENALKTKDKNLQVEDMKFCQMRKNVGSSKKYHSVSRTSIGELIEEINNTESKIQSVIESVKRLSSCIPQLEEEMELTKDSCSTVVEKLRESMEGYQKKEKMFRDAQDVTSKYKKMLAQCIDKECNPVELQSNILSLFEGSRIGLDDEAVDTHLLNEYAFQINTLKKTYDLIKGEPAKTMRDKSMAEFRLSQENSKILKEVHNIQNDAEKLRLVINQMETALGLQVGQMKSDKLADEVKNKIDFVVKTNERDKQEGKRQIAQLDLLIEEQQKEIKRFQALLADH